MRPSRRLILLALIPALVALVTASVVLWFVLPSRFVESAGTPLVQSARLLSAFAADLPSDNQAILQRRIESMRGPSQLRITLITVDGVVLADSSEGLDGVERMENHATRPEVREALRSGNGVAIRHSATTGRDYVYAATAFTDRTGTRRILRLAEPLGELATSRRHLLASIAVAAAVAAGVLGLLLAWVDRRVFVPLGHIVQGAGQLASGEFGHRVAIPDEEALGLLAAALNRLGGKVEEQIAAVGAERDHLRTILASMSEAVLVTDGRGRSQLVNPAFEALFGVRGEAVGRTALELTRLPRLADFVARTLAGREPASDANGDGRSTQVQLADPPRTLALAGARLPGGTGAVVVARDVSELTRLAEMRRDFVANVSHELKTPLAAIRGYAETLRDGALEDREVAPRFLARVLEQCGRLEALLADLLTLSRLESTDRTVERRRVELAPLVARAVDAVTPLAQARGVRVETLGELRRDFELDPDGVERLLTNLLENAVKYNRPGGSVTVEVVGSADRRDLVLEVRDTGVGIPRDALPRIFERFYRVDRGRAREEGGTGLGLAIVKHVAQSHGGRVEVESEPGRGSTFRVLLPEPAATPASA